MQSFAAVLSILLVIAASTMFVRLLTEASAGVLSSELMFQLLLLKLVGKLVVVLPAAIYVGILLSLGRLYKDSEIVAMWAGGIGTLEIIRSMLWLLLGSAIVIGVISLYVSPQAMAMHNVTKTRAMEQSEVSGLLPGRFMELREGELVAYIESLTPDGRAMENAFAQVMSGGTQDLLVAKRAYIRGDSEEGVRYVVLEDGYRYSGTPGSVDYVIYRFQNHAFRIDAGSTAGVLTKAEARTTSELLRLEGPAFEVEFQWRLSQPVSVVLLGLLAVPLARTSPRQGKYAKIALGIAIYFLYGNAAGILRSFVDRGDLSPMIGIWPVHLVMAVIIVTLIRRQVSMRRPASLRPPRAHRPR